MTIRRPIRSTGKWRFQAFAQSASWTRRADEVADGPQAEGLEVAELAVRLRPRRPQRPEGRSTGR